MEEGPHCDRWTREGDPGRISSMYKGLETMVTAGWAGWGQLEGGVRGREEARGCPLLREGPHPLGHGAGKEGSGCMPRCLCPGGANGPNGFIKPVHTQLALAVEEMVT